MYNLRNYQITSICLVNLTKKIIVVLRNNISQIDTSPFFFK